MWSEIRKLVLSSLRHGCLTLILSFIFGILVGCCFRISWACSNLCSKSQRCLNQALLWRQCAAGLGAQLVKRLKRPVVIPTLPNHSVLGGKNPLTFIICKKMKCKVSHKKITFLLLYRYFVSDLSFLLLELNFECIWWKISLPYEYSFINFQMCGSGTCKI